MRASRGLADCGSVCTLAPLPHGERVQATIAVQPVQSQGVVVDRGGAALAGVDRVADAWQLMPMDEPPPAFADVSDADLVRMWQAGGGEGEEAEAIVAEMARREIDF